MNIVIKSTCLSIAVSAALFAVARAHDEPAVRHVEGLKQTTLYRTELAEFPGKEAVVFIGEFQPLVRTGRHRHPGTEFLYVLEGNGLLEQAGREPIALQPGVAVFSEPDPGGDSFTHEARNLSETDIMKTFVILIVDKGSPFGIPIRE